MILAALLLGCPARHPYCLNASNTSVTELVVELGSGDDCADTPVVRQVDIRLGPDETTVWSLFSADGTPLRTLHYGEVPSGFESARPAEPLIAGSTVVIEVKGPIERGGLTFTLTP